MTLKGAVLALLLMAAAPAWSVDDMAAQLDQAKLLMRGQSSGQPQARQLFAAASGQGSGAAAYYLGLMQKNGLGGPVDQAGALQSLLLAAGRGVAQAMFLAANMLVETDEAAARHWLDAACEAEYPEALVQKSLALSEGRMGYAHNEAQGALYMKMAQHAMGHRREEP